jgi:hypothetical protein
VNEFSHGTKGAAELAVKGIIRKSKDLYGRNEESRMNQLCLICLSTTLGSRSHLRRRLMPLFRTRFNCPQKRNIGKFGRLLGR